MLEDEVSDDFAITGRGLEEITRMVLAAGTNASRYLDSGAPASQHDDHAQPVILAARLGADWLGLWG
jgi:hypothetical protein